MDEPWDYIGERLRNCSAIRRLRTSRAIRAADRMMKTKNTTASPARTGSAFPEVTATAAIYTKRSAVGDAGLTVFRLTTDTPSGSSSGTAPASKAAISSCW